MAPRQNQTESLNTDPTPNAVAAAKSEVEAAALKARSVELAAAKAEVEDATRTIAEAQQMAARAIAAAETRKTKAEAKAKELTIIEVREQLDALLPLVDPATVLAGTTDLVDAHAQARQACADVYARARDYRKQLAPTVAEIRALQQQLTELGEPEPEHDPGAVLERILPHITSATTERLEAESGAGGGTQYALNPDAVHDTTDFDALLDRLGSSRGT